MNKKLGSVLLAILVALLFATPVFAYYGWITGQLQDGYGHPWTLGGTVNVYHCVTGAPLGSETILPGPSGTFSISLSDPGVFTPLCIEVIFNAGAGGQPGVGGAGPYPNRSTSTGTLTVTPIRSGTGPTAVVLKEVTAQPSVSSIWLPVALLGVVLAAGGFWAMRQRQRA